MKILIEGYHYDATEQVKNIVREIAPLQDIDQQICVSYVGYFFNPHIGDCVFILPKVLLDEKDQVFGHIKAVDIIDLEGCKDLRDDERKFIYEFAVWIYRAIVVFSKDKEHKDIVLWKQYPQVGFRKRYLTNTYLDIIHAMVEFNRMNKSYFTFILKNLHSGFNRIHWPKTIARTTAIVQDDEPFYLRPVNRKRMINFDEELLIIFFSILNYIHEEYGFPVEINNGFDLITGKRFQQYLKGFGKTRLKQIKYKYFSDKALQIWELCYAFFERAHQIAVPSDQREYLIVKNFNIVFEAIIDELIGDKLDRGMEEKLKKQPDGKLVDHIFKYRSLTHNEGDKGKDIYYIGDSKYYKIGAPVSEESVYKQYTYARNVIQWNLDLFLKDKDIDLQASNPMLRDEETEGYNIIPNFFISAKIDKDLSYRDDIDLAKNDDESKSEYISYHFENRLFDRDTLLISHYNVNFLYVVSLYARDNASQKAAWKKKVKEMFREQIQELLNKKYDFYAMSPATGNKAHEYIQQNFQTILGKTFKPLGDTPIFSLALDKSPAFKAENERLRDELAKNFFIEKCPLGVDPTTRVPMPTYVAPEPLSKPQYVLVGYLRNEYYDKFINQGIYYARTGFESGSMHLETGFDQISYVLFHNDNRVEIHKASQKGPRLVSAEELRTKGFNPHGQWYLVYSINKKPIDLEYNGHTYKAEDLVIPPWYINKGVFIMTMDALLEEVRKYRAKE